ncbi:unnamed protein product [Rotaria sp. Silwood1]|nr:unnamed protein product [Rotaria sp. Silwood1]CAF3527959.1 unnamed protein product [Rotaria sp. Silwood1]CAF4582660.1 unnamed protein product [Rotaria sp. Silwood1]
MLKLKFDGIIMDQTKYLSCVYRYYLFLKAYYFLTYSSFAAIGPMLNITLRSRGLSNIEISCINLIIPFLIFFTNPLLAFFTDHVRHYRLTFNVILCLATIIFGTMFFFTNFEIKFNPI